MQQDSLMLMPSTSSEKKAPTDLGPAAVHVASGLEFCPVIPQYGALVSIASEEFRAGCEARFILDIGSKERRRQMIDKIVRMRTRGIVGNAQDVAQQALKKRLEDAVIREWEWRKKTREQESAHG